MTTPAAPSLTEYGLANTGPVHFNLSAARLVEEALRRHEGILTVRGALVAHTGAHTGRSPKDRFLVVDAKQKNDIWWGSINREMPAAVFDRLLDRVRAYLQGRELYVCDAAACAEPRLQMPVRVIADKAWHTLFAQALLRIPEKHPASPQANGMTIIVAADMHAVPATDGTRSQAFIILNLAKRLVLI